MNTWLRLNHILMLIVLALALLSSACANPAAPTQNFAGVPPPQGQIFNQQMMVWYRGFLAQGMTPNEAAAATNAKNREVQGPLGVGHELLIVQPSAK